MKKIFTLILITISIITVKAQTDIRPKLGNGAYPIDTIIKPTRLVVETHWNSYGPYPHLKNQIKKKQDSQQKKVRTTAPSPNNHADGFSSSNLIPMDNNVAISNENQPFWSRQVVSLCNGTVEFYDETSTLVSGPTGLNFWVNNSALFTNSSGFFDPKIIYDPINDHFIATLLYTRNANQDESKLVVLVSHNGDPANGWEVFNIDAPSGYWYDYPSIGMNKEDFFITVNQITVPPGASSPGTDVFQIPKSDLYTLTSNSSLSYNLYDDVVDFDNLNNRGICVVTEGNPQMTQFDPGIFLISIATTSLGSKVSHYDITDNFSGTPVLQISSFNSPNSVHAPTPAWQKNSSNRLDCGKNKIQYAYILNGIEHFVLNATTSASITQSSIYYYQFDVSNITATMQQITPNTTIGDREWYSFPSLCHMGTTTKDKTTAITYSASGENLFPEVRTVLFDDNMVASPQSTFRIGDNFISQNGTNSTTVATIRWGDYTCIQRIYDNDCPKFYLSNTFGNNANEYATFVADSECMPTSVSNTKLENQNFIVYPTITSNFINIEYISNNNGKINFEVYNLEGKKIIENYNSAIVGINKYQLTLSKFSNGIYFLKIKNDKNELTTKKIIKN